MIPRTVDVAVVGAGLAGILAARGLAQAGLQVLLLDRAQFPRWKVCGCCLNPFAQATLAAANLQGLTAELGAVPIPELRLASRGVSASLSIPDWVSLSRLQLDSALIRHAEAAGVVFRSGSQVRLGPVVKERRTLRLEDGTIVAARLVLAADGLGGRLLAEDQPSMVEAGSHVGVGVVVDQAPSFYHAGTVFMAHGPHGYLGLVRLEDGRLNLAAAFDPRYLRRCQKPGVAAEQLLATVGWPEITGLRERKWRGTPPLTRRPQLPGAERVLAIGDAAGYVEPFTGEGMAWALASGLAVVEVAQKAVVDWHADRIREWTELHGSIIRQRQWVCRGLAWLLRRPSLTLGVVGLLQRFPWLAGPFVGQIGAFKKRPAGAVPDR